jgi:hypothetical protein
VKDLTTLKLRDFRGVDPKHVARLQARGIKTTAQMLAAGSTKQQRAVLANETGVPEQALQKLVKLSDLARLPGSRAFGRVC